MSRVLNMDEVLGVASNWMDPEEVNIGLNYKQEAYCAAMLRELREALADHAPRIRCVYFDPSVKPARWHVSCDCSGCRLARLLSDSEET